MVLRIGVVGYCPPTRFDEGKAGQLINEAYNRIRIDFSGFDIIVVSGITNCGVLKIAYEQAKKRGWKTAGVGCKKALDFKNNWFPIDEEPVIIGDNWGDESEYFINSIDALIRVGGGPQSLRESDAVKKMGKPVYEYELEKLV
ncbi:hypothetical protein JW756_04325 [Candidatus Woesearchaeota archaeon]|nr:hypothetical protein [Candidatus Woesearchaeota archaeon]